MIRRILVAATFVVATVVLPQPAAFAAQTTTSNVSYHRFVTSAAPLSIASGVSATWTSPVFAPGFAFTELVASWNAVTPTGSLVEVDMQASPDGSYWTKWYVMGLWTYEDTVFHRTSVGSQGDNDGTVAIDTFVAGKR